MPDADLAALYGVEAKVLVQAVKRNVDRFPEDFMFQLTKRKFDDLRSHFVTSSAGGRRYPPYAFAERGASMLSGVSRGRRAIQANVELVRAFVQFRRMPASHADLTRGLSAMEKKYDDRFKIVFRAMRELMAPPESKKKREIGFAPSGNKRG